MSNEDYVDDTNNVDGFHGNLENPLRNSDELLDDDIFMDANLANAEVGASESNEGTHFDQLDESYKIDGLVATLSAGKDDRFRSMRDWAINTVDKMKADDTASAVASNSAIPATHTDPRDPPIRRRAKDRAGQRCSICRELGHNKTTCPDRSKYDRGSHERHSLPTDDDAYEAMWDEEEDFIYEEDESECAVNSSSESSRDQDMEIDDSNYEFGNEDDGANEIN
ncbi:hypothetical protein HN51_006202 [Arachis hypogaea]